jgi:carbon monoxide dehydrogenase subunit G
MDISGDYLFDAPQDLVWEALLDPNVLGSIMPGGQGIETVGENAYQGKLQIKIGPVQGTFQGDIQLSDITAPEGYKIAVDGKGAPGFVKATGNLHLEPRDQQTFMTYSGTAQIGGRIASVGQRLIDSSARSIIRQSLEALNEYLKVKVAEKVVAVPTASTPAATEAHAPVPTGHTEKEAEHANAPAPVVSAYKPPSQMSLMVNVARDVISDFIPRKYQASIFTAAVIIIVVLLIWFFASQ